MYDQHHRVTRAGALQIIAAGGSVLLKARDGHTALVSTVEGVPDESWFTTNYRITRADAEATIRTAGSFTLNGVRYTSIEDLPSAKEFDAANSKATKATRDDLVKQREALDKQLEEVDAPPTSDSPAPAGPHTTKK